MSSKFYTNQVDLVWQKNVTFIAKDKNNQTIVIDGSPDIGGQDLGVRPMETVLMGLAGCAAIDVVVVLKKADFVIDGFNVRVLAYHKYLLKFTWFLV